MPDNEPVSDLNIHEKTQAAINLLSELVRGEKSGKEYRWIIPLNDVESSLGIRNN
jgi:hypothetical protein